MVVSTTTSDALPIGHMEHVPRALRPGGASRPLPPKKKEEEKKKKNKKIKKEKERRSKRGKTKRNKSLPHHKVIGTRALLALKW